MESSKADLDETLEKIQTLRERVDGFTTRLPKLVAGFWRQTTRGGRDTLAPMFHALLRDGTEHVIGVSIEDPSQKDAVAEFIRLYARAHDAIVVAFVSEAWMIEAPHGDRRHLSEYRGVAPSESPNRIEILFANCETPFGQTMDLWKIDRTGPRAKLKRQKRVSNIESRFFGAVAKLN